MVGYRPVQSDSYNLMGHFTSTTNIKYTTKPKEAILGEVDGPGSILVNSSNNSLKGRKL